MTYLDLPRWQGNCTVTKGSIFNRSFSSDSSIRCQGMTTYRRALTNINIVLDDLILVRIETRSVIGRKNHHSSVSVERFRVTKVTDFCQNIKDLRSSISSSTGESDSLPGARSSNAGDNRCRSEPFLVQSVPNIADEEYPLVKALHWDSTAQWMIS